MVSRSEGTPTDPVALALVQPCLSSTLSWVNGNRDYRLQQALAPTALVPRSLLPSGDDDNKRFVVGLGAHLKGTPVAAKIPKAVSASPPIRETKPMQV